MAAAQLLRRFFTMVVHGWLFRYHVKMSPEKILVSLAQLYLHREKLDASIEAHKGALEFAQLEEQAAKPPKIKPDEI